jgi:uncharacterized membrane protein
VLSFAEWLSGTALSVAIQSTFWFTRLLQATHLLCAGIVVVSGLMIPLRVLAVQRADEPFEAVWARFAPWLAWSLAFMLLTGIAQTLGDPVRELTATSYWVKLALGLTCAAGTLLLGRAVQRAAPVARPPRAAKLMAVALVFGWLAIPWLGRMIAYDLAFWGELSLRP